MNSQMRRRSAIMILFVVYSIDTAAEETVRPIESPEALENAECCVNGVCELPQTVRSRSRVRDRTRIEGGRSAEQLGRPSLDYRMAIATERVRTDRTDRCIPTHANQCTGFRNANEIAIVRRGRIIERVRGRHCQWLGRLARKNGRCSKVTRSAVRVRNVR